MQIESSSSASSREEHPSRLRLRIAARAESRIRAGHPWLYAESVQSQNRPGQAGELAVIYDRRDQFLAIGLFDPESPLRVRILHRGKPEPINAGWWRARLEEALRRREGLFDAGTTGYRWIHGESDGWPGLVLDRYDATAVLKLYTAAWLPRLPELVELVSSRLPVECLVLRLSRNIQTAAGDRLQISDGAVLRGPPLDGPVIFLETGLRFEADVLRGQKTGFFLDQRENRRRVESLAGGRAVLNVFSFSGGFSLYAARGGAHSILDLDISAHALAGAKRNFALNRSVPNVAACAHETAQADAFDWLETGTGRTFDLIVLDPPSLARRESERAGAVRAYRHLVRASLKTLRRRGVLVAASCSAHVPAGEFFDAVRQSARAAGRSFAELAATLHPPDHPAAFREAEYLKCLYLRFDR